MFGFGEKKEKEREQRKVKWVAPTTGNVYYEDEDMPKIYCDGPFYVLNGTYDDWLDKNAPERAMRDKQDSENIEEMKKMMMNMARRQEELENMVARLIRRQYDREQRETKAEMEEETEYHIE